MSSGMRRKASFKSNNNRKGGAGPSNNKKAKNIDLGYRDDDGDDDDEMIDSGSEDDNRGGADSSSEDEEDKETVDAKRVRLARAYLEKLQDAESSSGSEAGSDDDDDNGRDKISMRLQRQRLKRQGTLERAVANIVARDVAAMHPTASAALNLSTTATSTETKQASQQWVDAKHATYFRGHDLTVSCVALQASGELAVSGSKDNSVLLWDVERQTKLHYLCPQWKKSDNTEVHRSNGEALSVACSDDGRYAVVGRRDATVQVFDIRQSAKHPIPTLASSFKGHKGPVTCLAFRTHSNQLFSGSTDRCIRHYSLDEMTYMETLYGHQAAVSGLACHAKERPISVGRDRTARAWKLADDAHLIFRGGSKVAAADCVTLLRDEWFVTGHDDGNVSLWLTEKKKSVSTVAYAHGHNGVLGTTDAVDGGVNSAATNITPNTIGRGITAIGALKGSDMVASGSNDGYLRLWRVMMGETLKERGIESIGQIPVHGYINDVAIGPKARFCVVAVGQEPSLGRWDRVAKAKNRFGIIQLRSANDDDAGKDADEALPEETIPEGGSEIEGSSDDEE